MNSTINIAILPIVFGFILIILLEITYKIAKKCKTSVALMVPVIYNILILTFLAEGTSIFDRYIYLFKNFNPFPIFGLLYIFEIISIKIYYIFMKKNRFIKYDIPKKLFKRNLNIVLRLNFNIKIKTPNNWVIDIF